MTYALAAAFPEPLSGAAGRGVGPVYFRVCSTADIFRDSPISYAIRGSELRYLSRFWGVFIWFLAPRTGHRLLRISA